MLHAVTADSWLTHLHADHVQQRTLCMGNDSLQQAPSAQDWAVILWSAHLTPLGPTLEHCRRFPRKKIADEEKQRQLCKPQQWPQNHTKLRQHNSSRKY